MSSLYIRIRHSRTAIILGLVMLMLVASLDGISAASGALIIPQTDWTLMNSGVTTTLFGVAGNANDNVLGVGSFGSVLHYDGVVWQQMTSGTGARLFDVWMAPNGEALVVGQGGMAIHYDRQDWGSMTSNTGVDLQGVWGVDADNAFAVGLNGVIVRLNIGIWMPMTSSTTEWLWDVWGSDDDDVFAVGSSGTILHYDGAAWSSMISGVGRNLMAVWGRNGNDVFAVGMGGKIVHYDGESWSAMTSGTGNDLLGVWGEGGGNVFAVGEGGVILHYDGSSWSPLSSGTVEDLRNVWGSGTGDVFAVGDGGVILHYQHTPDAPQPGPIFIVNTADDVDDGVCSTQHCSLREAIDAVNTHANGGSPDQILFDLPGDAVIRPGSALPVITEPVTIDGALSGGRELLAVAGAESSDARFDATGNVLESDLVPAPSLNLSPLQDDLNVLCFSTRHGTGANNDDNPCVRIERLFSHTTSFDSLADFPDDLSGYDVVYIGLGDSHRLRNRVCQLIEFVRNGAGLVVSQPTVVGEVGLFPAGFDVVVADNAWPGYPYNVLLVELTPTGASHPMLQGLTPQDLSPIFDTVPIDQLGSGWRVLAKGVGYPYVSLAVGSYGSGRLVFHTGNLADSARDGKGSDAYVQQMIAWAGTPGLPSDPDIAQQGDVYVVNAADDLDDGVCGVNHCSLREAMAAANTHANGAVRDAIRFDIPCTTERTVVQLQAPLPVLTEPVKISGGSSAANGVELDGSVAGQADGFVFTTDNSLLQGFIIHSFSGHGVVLRGNGNVVSGNYIGTRGFDDRGNGGAGVQIDHGSNNRVGGDAAGSSNLIAGNSGAGVVVDGGTNHVIAGNFIGVNAFGDAALANAAGVQVLNASQCTVGGATSGARNLISGNSGAGIEISGGGQHSVWGNVIGLALDETQALANNAGMIVHNSGHNALGGEARGQGNVVAGNRYNGLRLIDSADNQIVRNFIGTLSSGVSVGNGGQGVKLEGASMGNVIGPDNRIAFNHGAGLLVDGPVHNTITRNLIYANGEAIDNANGGNTELTPPQITAVSPAGVQGAAPANSRVELFGDDDGQGRYFLGSVDADVTGHFAFADWLRGLQLTATATDAAGNTSEFSPPALRQSPCADPYESNDDWTQSQVVSAGETLHGAICDSGDIDFFKLPASAVEFGGTVRFLLENVDADLDLVLFRPTFITYDLPFTDIPTSQAPAMDVPVESLPLQNIPLQNIPLQNIPLQNIPLQNIPLQNIPLQNIPLQNIPLQNIPLQNIPLQNIPLQNIPLQNIPLQNIPIVDYSVNPDTQNEEVNDRLVFASDAYYLMVVGHNGAYGRRPYTLTVEVTPPPQVPPCTFDPPFSGSPGSPYQRYPDSVIQTLILIPKQRLAAMYGEEAVAPVVAALQAFASISSVKGVVLPVENDEHVAQVYADWDEHFCDPWLANAVTGRIKGLIYQYAQQMPNLHNVVLIGEDAALPFRRMPDLVETANERAYAPQSLLESNNALYAALKQGYMLSDDFYVDFYPSLYAGWPLYAPDLAIGRLVETPAEITAQVEQYQEQEGKLAATTATVFGYDFLKDSSQQIADSFGRQGLQKEVVNNDTWDAATLRNTLLQAGHDLNALNAHFTHFLLASAIFDQNGQDDLFQASEIANATVDMKGSINVSVGCHSGYNVCDDCINQLGQTMGADLDFAQAFASKQALWIGNSGYGYGDDAAVALSEELVSAFVRYLGSQTDMSVGEALRRAKLDYAMYNMGAYGPYDRKVLNESILYGIPNYQVTVPYPAETSNQDSVTAGPLTDVGAGLKTRTFTLTPLLTLVSTDRGDYFLAEDEAQPLLYNPIQPRSQFDIALDANAHPGFTAHGALFVDGNFQDITDFDPVITMPITDTRRYEPQIIFQNWQPPNPARINHFLSDAGVQEWLTVTPGQFLHQRVESSDPAHVRGIGTERTYQQMRFQMYYSDKADFAPPIINQVQATRQNNQLSFAVRVSDPDGVLRVMVSCTGDDERWQTLDLAADGGLPEHWLGTIQNAGEDASCVVQAVDNAGNVAFTAAKGQLYHPEMPYRAYLPVVSAQH